MATVERPAMPEDAENARLEGELLGAMSEIAGEYGLGRSELAWAALNVLRQQIRRDEGFGAYMAWSRRAAEILGDEVDSIIDVLNADAGQPAA